MKSPSVVRRSSGAGRHELASRGRRRYAFPPRADHYRMASRSAERLEVAPALVADGTFEHPVVDARACGMRRCAASRYAKTRHFREQVGVLRVDPRGEARARPAPVRGVVVQDVGRADRVVLLRVAPRRLEARRPRAADQRAPVEGEPVRAEAVLLARRRPRGHEAGSSPARHGAMTSASGSATRSRRVAQERWSGSMRAMIGARSKSIDRSLRKCSMPRGLL